MQETIDLLAGLAALAAKEAAPTAPVAPAAPRRKAWTPSAKQISMINEMLNERYEEAEALRRFQAFDWENLSYAKFQSIFQWLKTQPKLSAPKLVVQAERGVIKPRPAKIEVSEPLLDGRYTVSLADGEHRTFRLATQPKNASFKPGVQIIELLTGSDNNHDYTGIGEIAEGVVKIWFKHRENTVLPEALRILVGDPTAGLKGFAQESGICPFCHNALTHPNSIYSGWGEKCATKRGLPYSKAPEVQ